MKNMMLKNYLEYLKGSEGKSESTIKQYKNDLVIWFNYMKEEHFSVTKETIKRVELSHIHGFLFYLDQKGNSAITRRRKVSTLKSFFNYLRSLKIINEDIMIDISNPKVEKKIPRYFDIEECKKLIESVGGRNKLRDRTIIKLFLSTGMRLNEVVNLNITDVQKNTIIIKGKGNKERNIYISSQMMNQLNEYVESRKNDDIPALFINERGSRLKKEGIQRIVKNAIQRAALNNENINHILVHTLRHSFATNNYQSGDTDIRALQEMLGHENISTTQIYTQVAAKKLGELAENSIMNSII